MYIVLLRCSPYDLSFVLFSTMRSFAANPQCTDSLENDVKKLSVNRKCGSCGGVLVADLDWKVVKCFTCKTEIPVSPEEPDFQAFRYIGELQRAHLGNGQTIDESPPEYIKEVEKYVDPVKNVYLLHLREEAFVQAEQLFKMTEKPDFLREMFQLGGRIMASYNFYHLTASSHPVLCAKMGEMAFAMGEKEASIGCFEKAQSLWSEICYPGHHLVKELEDKINKLKTLQKKPKVPVQQ